MPSEIQYLYDNPLILPSGKQLKPFPLPEYGCVQYCRRMPSDSSESVHYEICTIKNGDTIQGYSVVLHTEYETADGDANARKKLISDLRCHLRNKGIGTSNFVMGASWSWLDLHSSEMIQPGLSKEEFIRRATNLLSELYNMVEDFLNDAEHEQQLNPYGWDEEEEASKKIESLTLEDIKTQETDIDANLWPQDSHAISISVARLLKMNLKIPYYQRPYKWKRRNVIELLRDVENAIESSQTSNGAKHYRLGTIILHEDKDNGLYNVVDGQQRLLTLALLLFCLKSAANNANDLHIPMLTNEETLKHLSRQPTSRKRLHDNFFAIKEYLGNRIELRRNFYTALFNLLQVVITKVDREDEAFQLFDSQNTRGRSLDPHDLLKAYHLRAMQMAGASDRQMKRRVMGWESVSPAAIRFLFDSYLFRIYNWARRQKTHTFSVQDIAVFKGLSSDRHGHLYPFVRRAIATGHEFQLGEDFQAGECFFALVEHYLDLRDDVDELLQGDRYMDEELKRMLRNVSRVMHCPGTPGGFRYLNDLFRCVLFCYADRFGVENLDSRILAKLGKWAYSVMLDRDRMSEKTVNRYAIGESGYTNTIAMFAFIQDALLPTELVGQVVEMAEKNGPLHRRLLKMEASI